MDGRALHAHQRPVPPVEAETLLKQAISKSDTKKPYPAPVTRLLSSVTADAEAAEVLEAAPAARSMGVLVGRADDPCEAQADRVATGVVQALRRGVPSGQGVAGPADPAAVHRLADGGPDQLGGTQVPGVLAALQRRRGGGSSLPDDLSSSMGTAFGGHDFGAVRVHTDGEADALTRSVDATAFTHGSDVYFRAGTFDPSSPSGQHVLAHELTHVVQNAVGVRRKVWSAKRFEEATYENWRTRAGSAQKELKTLLLDYGTRFEEHGVVSPADAPKALERVRQMSQIADYWITAHQVESKGETLDDPDRAKRMAGFQAFKRHLGEEAESLAQIVVAPPDGTVPEVEKEPDGVVRMREKYTGDAKGFFERFGALAETAVSDDGDEAALEGAVKFPIGKGVGFIGGKFAASISKDAGKVKVRGELAITGGADVQVAEVAGELGGYIEAQADSGADCMSLVSYALYRRFRESNALPREAASYCWGGNTKEFGAAKAEKWSLDLEQQMFAMEEMPLLADFFKKGRYPDKATASAAFEAEKARVTAANEAKAENYVESGALLGVGASAGIGSVKAEASARVTEGLRVDLTSLIARKGGAGKANKGSSGLFAGLAQAATGGKRGAQKRTGRAVRTFMIMAGVSGSAPFVGSIGGSATLSSKWMNNGETAASGANATTLTEASFELAAKLGLPLAQLGGDLAEPWLEMLADKVEEFVQDKARPAAAKADEEDEDDDVASMTVDSLEVMAEQQLSELTEDLATDLEELKAAAGIVTTDLDDFKLLLTFDLKEKAMTLELRKQGSASASLGVVSGGKSSSKRLFRFVNKGAGWARA